MIKIYFSPLWLLLAIAVLSFNPNTASADDDASNDDDAAVVVIVDPYIELHSGPHRGYPIVHVCEKFETVTILKRRTDWYEIITSKGKIGWVSRYQMGRTLGLDGQGVELGDPTFDDYINRNWEFGFLAGDFGGADALMIYGGYRFTKHVAMEMKVSQATGNFSNSQFVSLGLVHQPFPDWRISPFFTLGASIIKTNPSATLVQTEDRTDNALLVGVGAYYYISRRFMLRMEYSNHLVLTSRNVNEEIYEWKAGFSVFF